MEEPHLDTLLTYQRFPSSLLTRVFLLLYSPLGLCLFLLRLFIGAHVFLLSCVLPDCVMRRFLVRVMTCVLGVVILESQPRSPAAKIYVSNHRTSFDHNAVGLLTPCSTPSVSCSPGFLCWARGFLELGAPGSRSQLQESLKHYLSQPGSCPLLLFPEEETTNGRAGLLHFSSWAFSLSDCVQPLSLTVSRPLVSETVAGSPWYIEMFWMLFTPYTSYHVRWLPVVNRHPRESDEEFASRTQKLLASALGVVGTSHTAADREERIKRRSRDPPSRTPRALPLSKEACDMAQRVKEVLPQVPISVIHQDLAQTRCVDTTITNLLEGQVPFLPEEDSISGNDSRGGATSRRATHKGFARRSEDRHLSLQERKELLYEHARRRYLKKFGGLGPASEEEPRG